MTFFYIFLGVAWLEFDTSKTVNLYLIIIIIMIMIYLQYSNKSEVLTTVNAI